MLSCAFMKNGKLFQTVRKIKFFPKTEVQFDSLAIFTIFVFGINT